MAESASPPGSAALTQPDLEALRWHTLTAEEVASRLGTGDEGLSEDETRARLEHFGPNELEQEQQASVLSLLLHQFRDPLIYILLVAGAVTLILRDYTDSAVIFIVVILNATIGFVQEYRAREAMRALARLSAPRADVVRRGQQRQIATRDLVPGDIVLLTSGGRVPADLRLIEVRGLEADESLLTGESRPVRKVTDVIRNETAVAGDQRNMAFSGTTITRGRGRGIVVRTAGATQLGAIAAAMRSVGRVTTPLQEKMDRFGSRIGLLVVALSLVTIVFGLARGESPQEIFITAVAFAVAAIPEGLPVVLTVTLAIGVRRMARRNAIIRSLPAVETLGSTTVIGSDKTGTLTKNEMTVQAIWAAGTIYEVTGTGYALDGEIMRDGQRAGSDDRPLIRTLLSAVLANEAEPGPVESGEPSGDPTEIALHVAAAKLGTPPSSVRDRHGELDILPFEPERRWMATLNEGPEGRTIHMKGAPEAVLTRCAHMMTRGGEAELDAEAVRAAAAELAGRGLRVLATAHRPSDARAIDGTPLDEGFVLSGLLGMEDPVRPEAVQAIADVRAAGIRVLMITGDHVETARAVGAQLGLDSERALSGHEIQSLSDEALDTALRDTQVFARVAPEHKLRIVQRLKARNEIVAVTGDGVNDAPALRAAHLGVAMGATGTDVAREASDMGLADDNFATIAAAVEEGRIVYMNVRKVTFFLLSTGIGGVIAILAALFLGWPLPFIAVQILWMNLVTNGLQDVALAFEPGEPNLLRQPPRPPREGILSKRLIVRLIGVAMVIAVGTLGMFWWSLESTGDLDRARTVALTQIVVFQFFHVFNCRSLDRSILSIPLFGNPFLFVSVVLAALAHLAVLNVPALELVFRTLTLSPNEWAMILAVGTTIVLGGEVDKWLNRRRGQPLG